MYSFFFIFVFFYHFQKNNDDIKQKNIRKQSRSTRFSRRSALVPNNNVESIVNAKKIVMDRDPSSEEIYMSELDGNIGLAPFHVTMSFNNGL